MTDPKGRSSFDLGRSLEYFQNFVKESGPAASASYTLLASVVIFTILSPWLKNSVQQYPAEAPMEAFQGRQRVPCRQGA